MAPRYSVLLPTHNRADVVGYAISSVLAQTQPDFELLVVGDGCTDGTAAVVASFVDPRIRWFDLPKSPNFGYGNRNLALREASGELMAFMAHDDLLLPDHLALMGAQFDDDRVEWAYSRPLWVADDGRMVPFAVDLRVGRQLGEFLTHHNSIPASCVAYRRRLHERVGYWPEESVGSGDWELWKRIVAPDGANLAYVREPTTLHFRADWRDVDAWGPPPLSMWLEYAGSTGAGWPVALRVAMPPGKSPQSVFADALRADTGLQWVHAIRAAVAEAMDAAAWTASADLDEAGRRIGTAETRAAEAEERAIAAVTRATEAESTSAADSARAAAAEANATAAEARAKVAERRVAAADARAAVAEARAVASEARSAAAVARVARMTLPALVGRVVRRARIRLRGNPLFDARWYSRRYGDVSSSEAYRHWRRRGLRQGRDPNPFFATAAYLERYPDVRASGMNPLDHFYIFGASEDRSAEALPPRSG